MSTQKSILVATDFSACSDKGLHYAFELAGALDAQVHLVHVYSLQGMLEASAPTHEAIEDAEAFAERKLREAAQPFGACGRVGAVRAYMGEPAHAILSAAADLDADLIVVGTHGRRGLRRLVLGSVAESVVRQAACPVIVVRGERRDRERSSAA